MIRFGAAQNAATKKGFMTTDLMNMLLGGSEPVSQKPFASGVERTVRQPLFLAELLHADFRCAVALRFVRPIRRFSGWLASPQ